MPELSHPAWPLRFGPAGFVMVEQDSDLDLDASAAIITCTRRGHRDDLPAFGVTPFAFQQGALDVERYASELAASDDRLRVNASETYALAEATLRRVQANIPPGGPQ